MTREYFIYLIAAALAFGLGIVSVDYLQPGFGGTAPSTVALTDTVGTLRTEFNRAVVEITASTSTLGRLRGLASSTGNLIVGSSSDWIALAVGSNNLVLTASSTAQGGISWESSSGFSTSTAHTWGALQTFLAGIQVTTVSGQSSTSTLNLNRVNATSSAIDNVSSTNITASGLQTTTFNVSGQSTMGSVSSTQLSASIYGLFNGILRIPSAAAPTSTEVGGVAHDTSQNQLLVYGSSTVNVVQLGSEFKGGIIQTPTTTIDYTAFVHLPFEIALDRVYCGTDVLSTAITLNLWRRTNPTAATTSLASALVCTPTGANTSSFTNGGGASSTEIIGFSFSAASGTATAVPVGFWYRYPRY